MKEHLNLIWILLKHLWYWVAVSVLDVLHYIRPKGQKQKEK